MVTFSETKDGVVVIELEGKFSGTDEDHRLYDTVREQVDKGCRRLIIDFSGLRWANSSGIGIIVSVYLTVRRSGGDLRMACANDKIRHYFKISKLENVFEVFESVEEATRGFAETVTPEVSA